MIQDGLIFINGAVAENFSINHGVTLPVGVTNEGLLYALTQDVDSNTKKGLYIMQSGVWKPVGTSGTIVQSYDISGSVSGKAPSSTSVSVVLCVRAFTIAKNFAGSLANSAIAATASNTFIIRKNGTQVGSFTFAAGASSATFATTADIISFVAGDVLTVDSPSTIDSTLSDIRYTFLGSAV